jgi:AraC-like DNA-binding protein
MKTFVAPDIKILTCQSVRLQHWGKRTESFRAPFWRLYRNHQPGATVFFAGKGIRLLPTHIYLIPQETDFFPELRAPVRHFFLHFAAHAPFDQAMPGVYGWRIESAQTNRIKKMESLMLAPPTPAMMEQFNLCAFALVYDLLAHFPQNALTFRPVDEHIALTQAAIRNSTRSPLPNARLAALAHMTPNAFIRRFTEVAGESPQQYARRVRIEQACALLNTTGQSIEQIADATGFCDRFHFTRVFTQVRGVSPAAFRHTLAAGSGGRK